MIVTPVRISPVKLLAVEIRRVLMARSGYAWAAHLAGVNQYGEFTEWKPDESLSAVNFTIECDVFVSDNSPSYINVLGGLPNNYAVLQKRDTGTWWLAGTDTGIKVKEGLNRLKFTSTMGRYARCTCIGAGTDKDDLPGTYPLKGQISNLKLIDHNNPSNSRFYAGIVYSDTMPVTNVIRDEWDAADSPIINGFSQPDGFNASDAILASEYTETSVYLLTEGKSTSGAYYRNSVPLKDGARIQFKVDVLQGKFRFQPENTIGHSYKYDEPGSYIYDLVVVRNDKSKPFTFSFYSGGLERCEFRVTDIKITYSTSGVLCNLGTTQPHVPLLGDREAYAGEFTDVNYTSGVWIKGGGIVNITPNTNSGISGSWMEASAPEPLSILVSKNGAALKRSHTPASATGTIENVIVRGATDAQIQSGFEYPNVFRVIKPTDPDYGDYQ